MGIGQDSFLRWCDALAPGMIAAFKSRNIDGFYCRNRDEAKKLALSMIPMEATVTWGGSVTLNEIGLLGDIRKGGYKYVDRDETKTPEERNEAMRRAFSCDIYLTSVNALSEDGQLVNIDGVGNRVAAMSFGPDKVIVVAGMNKVCHTVELAERRARTYAAPLNAARLDITRTPCGSTGRCGDCKSPDCLCSFTVTTRFNRIPGRIKVILVSEPLGL